MRDRNEERRFARSQKVAMQRYREEGFCKIEADQFYEIPLEDGVIQYEPYYDPEEVAAMGYVDEITNMMGEGK